jgi:hypothetical protein
MAVLCACGTGGGNLGRPSCFPVFDVTKKAILVEYYKPDGSVNGVELASLTGGILDQTYLDARIKDVNGKTRWYPTPELKNITDERAEDITETFEDTSSVFIQEGARAFTGLIVKGDPVLLGNLQKWRCLTIGVFFIDKAGNLIGKQNRDGFLDPILLQDESFSPALIKGTDTAKQKDSISFIISQLENDANLRMIEAGEITANLISAGGLVDVNAGTPANVSVTGFDVQLNTPFGGVTSPIAAEGLGLADFEVFNDTTSAAVVITSVTESGITEGLYTFVVPTQTSGDVLIVTNTSVSPLTKNFDLAKFTVTIP